MKYLIFSFFILSGCSTTKSSLKNNPTNSNLSTLDHSIVDPLTDPSVASQTHFHPFLIIMFSVLLICFIPYLYSKASDFIFKIRKKY